MSRSLTPLSGRTRGGLPVSRNFAPSPDLAPFVTRIFVTVIDQPPDGTTSDFLLNETPFIRILQQGYWEAEIEPGIWRHYNSPVLFGAQVRRFNVRVKGPIGVLGCAVRPAGWRALFDRPAHLYADKLTPLEDVWGEAGASIAQAGAHIDDTKTATGIIEETVRRRLASRRGPGASAEMEAFERIARHDPGRPVADIASALGLSLKQLEHRTLGSFGHTPKSILRRSRFLDLAATMRGISTPSDDELAALRFYDQSHLTREVKHFTGMTPARFLSTATPLLTTGIEARQLRKAEEAGLFPPGAQAPWFAAVGTA